MTYVYILTYLGGCVNGICLNFCLCSEKVKIDNDNEENNELENRWYNSRLYINYLENILHNITPTRRTSIPFEFPDTTNNNSTNIESTSDSVQASVLRVDTSNHVEPTAPLAEASIIRD